MKQLDGRLGINGVAIADNGAKVVAIDDTIDVGPLPPGIGLARNQLWLFVDETQAMQQLGDPALAIGDLPGLLDIVCNLSGGEA